jgi:hypothetical protein
MPLSAILNFTIPIHTRGLADQAMILDCCDAQSASEMGQNLPPALRKRNRFRSELRD